jgi:anti-sigma factor RsiW
MAETHASPDDALAFTALLYASGELEGKDLIDFEARLEHDQVAREALAHAVKLSLSLTHMPQSPSPAYRAQVLRRLQPALQRRRLERPWLWAATGAVAAVFLLAVLARTTLTSPETPSLAEPVVTATNDTPTDSMTETANVWAELNGAEHLSRAHDEEIRRKSRLQDRTSVVRFDGGKFRSPPNRTLKR